ncbi:MAG TPA: hypothetical protein VF629_03600 [Hymenobacter sp.]|jgi:hypothetical protein
MLKPAYWFLASGALLQLFGCETLTKYRLSGTYYRHNPDSTATLAV